MKFTRAIVAALSIFALLSPPALADHANSYGSKSSASIKPFKSTFARKVSQDDLIFGMTQVDKMINDRKPMGFLVKKGDPIYNWAARQFAGEACGEHITWNNQEDLGKPAIYKADHCYPSKEEKAFIRIRSNNGSGNFYDEHSLWESCIFELHNIRNFKAFDKVYNDACKGKLTKEEWLRRNTMIEYKSNKAVKDFFYRNWAPFLTAKGIDYRLHLWDVDWTPETFEQWIGAYSDPTGYPYDYWGTYYDSQIIPYLKAMKSN
ncbi:MAG: hypothetical protein SFY67_01845 [Candidatus Melainabacteria bacterium]|nr:hypothetical protein [Candidatus Melainabacteria bacterium]